MAVSKSGTTSSPGSKNYVQIFVGRPRYEPRHALKIASIYWSSAHSCALRIGVVSISWSP